MKLLFHSFLLIIVSQYGFSQKDSLISQFEIQNSNSSPKMDVLNIDRVENILFSGREIRMVISGTGYATDFGAYMETFLVFDNLYEFPWRHAVYELGRFDNVKNIKKVSESSFSFEAVVYSRLSDFDCNYCVLKISVDISDVLNKEKKLIAEDDESIKGQIDSVIKVEVSKK